MLHHFFAVTQTSIYLVKDRTSSKDPTPIARKVAVRGESKIGVGETLKNGTMLAIRTQLQMYSPKGNERRIESINTRNWGGHSSDILALFKTMKKARECFESKDLVPCDPRWIADTKEVLEAIGEKTHRSTSVTSVISG